MLNHKENMLDALRLIELRLETILQEVQLNSMYIDYHPPFVSRIWFQFHEYRVYLHKIAPCNESKEALYHPHPWQSAIKILWGKYEMGIGHSQTNEVPKTDCKLILPAGTVYEMTEEDGWHYVCPVGGPVYSLMITGKKSQREMPIEPKKKFRQLTYVETKDILTVFKSYYGWKVSVDKIAEFNSSNKIA